MNRERQKIQKYHYIIYQQNNSTIYQQKYHYIINQQKIHKHL